MAYNSYTPISKRIGLHSYIPISKRIGLHSCKDQFDIMNETAKTSGLASEQLLIVCKWLESEELDEKRKLAIIECLIPTPGGTIPEEICIRLVCLLKRTRTSMAIKVEILKWMVSAYSLMETSGKFQMLYEMLFLLLKNDEMEENSTSSKRKRGKATKRSSERTSPQPRPSGSQCSAQPESSDSQSSPQPGPSGLQSSPQPGPSGLQSSPQPGPSGLQTSSEPGSSFLQAFQVVQGRVPSNDDEDNYDEESESPELTTGRRPPVPRQEKAVGHRRRTLEAKALMEIKEKRHYQQSIRTYAAQFLCLFTQKKHVTYKHIDWLLELRDEYDEVPSLALLLRVFFLLAPEHFEDDLPDMYMPQFASPCSYADLIKKVHPDYSPSYSIFLITSLGNVTTTVSEADTTKERVISEPSSSRQGTFLQSYKEFRAVERCHDISKILQSKWRRLLFTSRDFMNPESMLRMKVEDYILSMFHASLGSEDIVDKHLDLFRLQRSFPGMSEFTEFLLSNKKDWSPDILEVLCFEKICCFKKIQHKLRVVREKFWTTKDVVLKCQWLMSLTKMFCYWIFQSKKPVGCTGTCNTDDSDAASDTPLFHIAITEISQLGSEIDFLCETLLMEDCSPFVISQILQYYQMGAIACKQMGIKSPRFPPASVFQLSLFSLSPFVLETLSEFMLRMNAICDPVIKEYQIFQGSMNDVKKMFLGGSYKTESTYLSKSKTFQKLMKRMNLKDTFILHKHPAFLLTAVKFYDENDPKDRIDPDKRKQFLDHLAKEECKYFVALMSKVI